MKLEGLFIYKYMVFSYQLFLPAKKFDAQIKERLIYMSMGKKFHTFYAFELMIHFLAEESFLDMYSDDIISNVTRGV